MKKIAIAVGAAALTISGGAIAQQRMGGDVTLDQAKAMAAERFDKMDVNDDGVLNSADREARRMQQFDRLDTDNNGMLSREEWAAKSDWRGKRGDGERGERMGKRGHRGDGKMMGMVDTDNDGSITKAEMVAGVDAMFARADADNDGTITAAERKAAHEAMRTMRRQNRDAN